MKKISFIIPNYNGENTIGKVIESIKNQNYKGKLEIIVIDDKSKDNSIRIISKYKGIKFIKNKKNIGLAKSLNKAIKESRYDLLCIIWCDCVLNSKTWLREIVNTYKKNKNVGSVGSKLIIPKEYWEKFSFYDKIILSKDYENSLNNNKKEGRPTLFSKKILLGIGLYDSKTFRIAGEDTDLKWKIIEKGYKIINSKTSMLHLHGFYNLSLKEQLFNKALPLAEASGVNFARYGIKSLPNKYWNPISSTIVYLSLLINYINIISIILITIILIIYTKNVSKHNKNIKIIFVPAFKIVKDIITIFGFWKGFLTRKQEF